jgi:hypothetical protein
MTNAKALDRRWSDFTSLYVIDDDVIMTWSIPWTWLKWAYTYNVWRLTHCSISARFIGICL